MTSHLNSNEGEVPRLKMLSQSKIPKPKAATSSSMLSSFPVHLHSTDISTEPNTPATTIANNAFNLDLLLDSGLKTQMATAPGEEHSWFISADRGSDVDELLDQLEFEDCIDDGELIEGSIPMHYVPSDIEEESQGSHDGPIDTDPSTKHHQSGYLQAFVGKLCSMAKTLEWLKAQPFSFTPQTPLDRSNNGIDINSNDSNTRSGAASSCKSSRSLSAAFDLAALEPSVFQCSGATPPAASRGRQKQDVLEAELSSSRSYVSCSIAPQFVRRGYNTDVEDEEEDDFLSACSDCGEDVATAATALNSPGQASVSSQSSSADSDGMHASLLKASMCVGGVNEWLSNG
jgi:hypothetical protein